MAKPKPTAKKRRAHKHSPTLRSRHFLVSVAAFTLSALIFVHQCVAPLHALPAYLRSSQPSGPARQPFDLTVARHGRPRDWFADAAHSLTVAGGAPLEAVNSTASSLGHARKADQRATATATVPPATKPPGSLFADLPSGPFPLPPLRTADSRTSRAASLLAAGAAWTGSLAHGVMSALPLHWVAEAAHAPPQKGSPSAPMSGDSIFAARRKGAWIGCERPFHLVCKGVYRALKATDATHVVDVSCAANRGWLPHVVDKLRAEFRLVRLTCVVGTEEEGAGLRAMYAGAEEVKLVAMDAFTDAFPPKTDMLVAYRFLRERRLIEAMKFFKNVQKGGRVKYLAIESFPEETNKAEREKGDGLRVNVMVAPFWFPSPVYVYEDAEENDETTRMLVCAVKVEDMFRQQITPGMRDLVDPRKRLVRE